MIHTTADAFVIWSLFQKNLQVIEAGISRSYWMTERYIDTSHIVNDAPRSAIPPILPDPIPLGNLDLDEIFLR